MKKIFIQTILLLGITLLFSISPVFANEMDNAANSVTNAVNSVGNATADGVKDTAGAVKNGINNIGNATRKYNK